MKLAENTIKEKESPLGLLHVVIMLDQGTEKAGASKGKVGKGSLLVVEHPAARPLVLQLIN